MVVLENICKNFGDNHVLRGVNLTAETGKVTVILGPSGSGKSTLLRSINYLERPSSGIIRIGNLCVDAKSVTKQQIKSLRSVTAMVFQQFNLFKNLTALQNVILEPISVKHISLAEAQKQGMLLLEKVGLKDKMQYYPSQLSGGQQQRVAIARALAVNPEVLLFDEPTSALDPELVEDVLVCIKDLAKEGNTMIIVTHEIGFTYDIADKVVLFENGNIVEEADSQEFFTHPQKERTQKFLKNALQRFSFAADIIYKWDVENTDA